MSPFRTYMTTGVALAALSTPLCFVLMVMDVINPFAASNFAAEGTLAGMVLILLTPYLPGAKSESRDVNVAKMLYAWLWLTGITHITWELSWCIAHPYLHGVTGDDTWAWVWWAYGVADKRYLMSDDFIVPMEWFTAVVGGPLGLYALWLHQKKRYNRAAVWIIIVSATELYGTILYFGTEWTVGFENVLVSDFENLWFKFVAMNFIWIVLPSISIWAAVKQLMGLPAFRMEIQPQDAVVDTRAAA